MMNTMEDPNHSPKREAVIVLISQMMKPKLRVM